jgi:hypothetical protein
MIKDYKINKHNSTVCGYAGRLFDWSKFDWDSKTSYDFGLARYSNDEEDAEFVDKDKRGKLIGILKAPQPHIDDGLIAEGNQYLHVPFNWEEDATIYRVRPNDSMQTGNKYRGHLIKSTKAIKKEDGWYWRLEF